MAGIDMDWNLKKLGQLFQVLMVAAKITKKRIMVNLSGIIFIALQENLMYE